MAYNEIKEKIDGLRLKEYEEFHEEMVDCLSENNGMYQKLINALIERVSSLKEQNKKLEKYEGIIKWLTKKALYHSFLVTKLGNENIEDFSKDLLRNKSDITIDEDQLKKNLSYMAKLHDIGRLYENINEEEGRLAYGKNLTDHARHSYRMLMLEHFPEIKKDYTKYLINDLIDFNKMEENEIKKLDQKLDDKFSELPTEEKLMLFAVKWHSSRPQNENCEENLNKLFSDEHERKFAKDSLFFMRDIDVCSNLIDYSTKGHLDLIGEQNNNNIEKTASINPVVLEALEEHKTVNISLIGKEDGAKQTIMDTYCKFLGWVNQIETPSLKKNIIKNILPTLMQDIKERGYKLCEGNEEARKEFEENFSRIRKSFGMTTERTFVQRLSRNRSGTMQTR